MQTMQIAAVNQLKALPSLGVQSSGFLGDGRIANYSCLPAREASRTGLNVRATYSRSGPNAPLPSRTGQQPSQVQQSTAAPLPKPPTETPKEDPLAGLGGIDGLAGDDVKPGGLPTRPTSATATRPKTRPPLSPGFTGALGLNFPGSQIPGLPGSPKPKPGTPRPYDPTKQKSKVMEWLTPPIPPTELLQREHFKLSDTCACTIYFGDLSKWTVDGKSDAVIAPSNKKLNTGPAVNAVLFKAAGSKLLECTQRLPDVAPQGIKAEMGDAISTKAFNLPVARVIHTVGSVYKKDEASGKRPSDTILEKAYKTALMVARKENLKYLAFPPLSCNIYGYPYSEGAEVAMKALKENCEGFERIDIVIRNIEGYEAFIDEANKVLEVVKEKKTIKVPTMAPRGDPGLPPAAAAAAAATAQTTAPAAAEQAPFAPAAAAVQAPPEAQAPPAVAAVPEAPSAAAPAPAPPAPPAPTPVAPPPPSSTSPPPSQYEPPQYQNPPPPPQQQQYGAPQPLQYQNAPPQNQQQYRPPPPQYQNAPPQYQPQYNQNAPPQYQQQYNRNAPPQYQQQYNQNAPPQYQNTQPSAQNNTQYQDAPPQYQDAPPQYQNAPPQYQNAPPQFQNAPPQYQNAPPQYQNAPQYQNGPPPLPQQQYQPPPPTPSHQQQYQPPPPPPPPESTPIPPRQRASPYPPSGPPPKPPSTPTTAYQRPMY